MFAILLGATAAVQRPQIPTGGPIPDRRGFNLRVNDPKAVAEFLKRDLISSRLRKAGRQEL
jgi:hypothetical protein